MTKQQISAKISEVLTNGNWMIRRDTDGVAYNWFRWSGVGKWTIAPDWKPTAECGHGLHGQSAECGGMLSDGNRLVFCEYDPKDVVKLEDKIKVRRARILMVGIPDMDGVKVGSLDLRGCTLPEGLKLPDSVDGDLDLSGCTLPEGIKLPKIKRNIYK